MNAEVMQQPKLTLGRLLLLGASSVILCISFIMAVFAPFPLAIAIILYGRAKGYLVGVAGLVVSFVLANMMYGDLTLFGFYFCVFIFGVGIAEIVLRGIAPIKGMVAFGLGFILTIATGFAALMSGLNTTPKAFILEQIEKSADKIAEQKKAVEMSGDKDSIQVLQLLDRPDLIAKEMIESFPSYFFMGVFMMLWFNMFMVLKSRRLLFSGHDYPYSERNLLNFKVPFGFVIVLVVGLVFAVWGNSLFGAGAYESIGFTIIKCLGIFYFFQGFGVFSDLLNFLGIVGFFRTLIVMVTIFMANYLIAAAGLFDNWFDFRKYFVKRKTED
jgi:MFS family permease